MNYKAIIFDLDGTAIPNAFDGMPSDRLVQAVNAAKLDYIVSAATGRDLSEVGNILEKLKLSHPCVITGGAQILIPETGEIVWEKLLTVEQSQSVLDVLLSYPYLIYIYGKYFNSDVCPRKIDQPGNILRAMAVPLIDMEKIIQTLKEIPDISAHSVTSWTKGCFDIHITPREATKSHAINIWCKKLELSRAEVIGVGDSNNDLPLFESVGEKNCYGKRYRSIKESRGHSNSFGPG